MASVTIPDPFPKVNDAAVRWAKDVNQALQELQDRDGIHTTNYEAALVQADVAANAAGAVSNDLETVIIPSIQAPLAVPAPPTGLTLVATRTGWTETGNPVGEATIGWAAVTQDVNSNAIPIVGYEVLTGTAGGVLIARNLNPNPSFENSTFGGVNNKCTVAQSTVWAAQGTYSAIVTPNDAGNDSYFFLSAAEVGMEPSKVYTVLATIHLEAAQTGTLNAMARHLVVNTGIETTYAGFVPDNEPGTWDLRLTFTTGATFAPTDGIQLWNGASLGGGSVYWDNLAVIEVPSEDEDYQYDYFDGSTPTGPGRVYTWASTADASISSAFGTLPGSIIGSVDADTDANVAYTITGLLPGEDYDVQVRAVSGYGVQGILSDILYIPMPAAPIVALEPSPPLVDTRLGVVSVYWDGTLGEAAPLPGFLYVFAEFNREGTEDWAQFGAQLRKAGSVNLTTEPVGSSVRVRFRSVDNLGHISDPSEEAVIIVLGVTGPDIEANSITANHIDVGAVTVSHLEAGIGGLLDLTGNEFVVNISNAQQATDDNLAEMQTIYAFTPTEAIISAPDSNFTLAMDNDSIEIREGGVPVSWWNAGQMFVPSFVGDTVILGNHQLEKYGTGTVMRAL